MARSDSILSGFLRGIAECLLNSPIKHSFMLANYVDNRRVKSNRNWSRANPTGRPDTPHNCSLLNQTTDSIYVDCIEGFDGGLPQKFTMQVDREAGSGKGGPATVYNHTSKTPTFSVGNLDPGSTYEVSIYSTNAKGRSETVRFRATTLNLPERRTGESVASVRTTEPRIMIDPRLDRPRCNLIRRFISKFQAMRSFRCAVSSDRNWRKCFKELRLSSGILTLNRV